MVKRHHSLFFSLILCFLPKLESSEVNVILFLNSYQVPPLVVKKTGIVVSPLISLMQDQVI